MMDKKPWEHNSALTAESILIFAKIVTAARDACAEKFDEDSGDTNWGYGCRAREWTREAFRVALRSGKYKFLSIPEDSNQKFMLGIDGVPVKFYREDTEDPSGRVTKFDGVEEQLSLFVHAGMETSEPLLWRLLIDSNSNREVTDVAFVGFNNLGNPACFYRVPMDVVAMTVLEHNEVESEGIDIPPAQVRLKSPSDLKREAENNGE
jgi:hypothetical protein